jgi:hypothetical protein
MLCAPASAQGLRTLHVVTLSMTADRTNVRLGGDFHLTIHARVREHVSALDELVVPEVGTMHLLGDERRVRRGPAGTDVDETLTLEPIDAGSFTLPGAFLDAIDGRTGKPTRFTANAVQVTVGPAAPAAGNGWLRRAALALLGLLVAAMGVTLALRIAGRGRGAAPVAVASVPLLASASAAPRSVVRDALAAYCTAPSSDTLATLRGAVLAAAGTAPGATTRDALAATSDEQLRATLRAAEAATFASEDARSTAKEQFVETARGWLK